MTPVITVHMILVFSGKVDREISFVRVNNLLNCARICIRQKDCSSFFYDKDNYICGIPKKRYEQNDSLLSAANGMKYFSRGVASTRKWTQVLKTSKLGKATFGKKMDLQRYLDQGAKLRFLASSHKNTFTGDLDSCKTMKGDICCQSVFDISVDRMTNNSSTVWKMHMLCTTGNWHVLAYNADCSFPKQEQLNASVTWFVAETRYKKPVYSTVPENEVRSRDLNNLVGFILKGMKPSINVQDTYFSSIQTIKVHNGKPNKPRMISSDIAWSVSQKMFGNHTEFKRMPYWFFYSLTSSGKTDISKWFFMCHLNKNHVKGNAAAHWFIDEGWTDISTDIEDGSKITLRGKLLDRIAIGNSVRVKFGNTVVSADTTVLTDDRIVVLTVSGTGSSKRKPGNEIGFVFRVIDSTGTVTTYRPSIGSGSYEHPITKKMQMTWFVDTRKWMKLLHVLENGTSFEGSAISVRDTVMNGGEIRVGFRRRGSTTFRYCKVDNIHIQDSPHVTATVIRSMKDRVLHRKLKLDPTPEWSFKLVSTTGYIKTMEFPVGTPINNDWKEERAEIVWFAFA